MTHDPNLPATASVPHNRRRRRWPIVVVWSLVALLLVGAGTAALYVLKLNNSFDKASKLPTEQIFPEESNRPPKTEAEDTVENILLLGSDTRGTIGEDIDDIKGERSDSMMLIHLPEDRKSAQVISIMRDNWVEIPGHGFNKINAAMALGGVPLAVETVEGMFEARIDHVAVIDFDGFESLTDALGGVTIDNPQKFSVNGTDFPEGKITLNGAEALKFVRERHSFSNGDYSRVENQQRYLKAVFQKIVSKETLTSPGKISKVVDAISPYLTVDDALNASYATSLAWSLRNLDSKDIQFYTSPTLGTGTEGKASVVRPDWARIYKIREAIKHDELTPELFGRQ